MPPPSATAAAAVNGRSPSDADESTAEAGHRQEDEVEPGILYMATCIASFPHRPGTLELREKDVVAVSVHQPRRVLPETRLSG